MTVRRLKMFGLFVSSMECALMTMEAANVIGMRLQVIAKNDVTGRLEAELMLSEKVEAFAQAGADLIAGASNSTVRNNLRTIIQANEVRLKALRSAA
jgi:hypothetical protein